MMEPNLTPPAPKPANKLSTEVTAAIITGVFGLVTVLITTVFPKIMPERKETPVPTPTVTVTETAVATPETSGLATGILLTASLPEGQREIVLEGYSAALDLANKLPLMIRDEFETLDYGWAEAPRTEFETNFCEFKIGEGAYYIRIETKNASGTCWTTAPRQANNFLLSVDLSAANRQNLTTDVMFRFQDWENFYFLSIDPANQQFYIGQYLTGQLYNLADWTQEKGLHKNGVNQVSIIGTGSQITLYINQAVVASFTDPAPTSGSILLRTNLFETNSSYDLVVDNFILRGE